MWCSRSVWIIFVHAAATASVVVSVARAVIMVALVPFAGIELMSVHCLDVLPQGAWVGVPFGASRSFAGIRFLKKAKQN